MNKKILIPLIIVLILLVGGGIFLISRNNGANNDEPELVETPPEVKKINSLALAKQPYVSLIPHSNSARCDGVDLIIESLKNNEGNAEYELEYLYNNPKTGSKMIEGMTGNRNFAIEEEHQPLEFGTCSKGKCVCHDDIISGSLQLRFAGSEDYVLKQDFTAITLSKDESQGKSLDGRLSVDFVDSLSIGTKVIISSTFGLPENLTEKVIKGPYGIFVEGAPELDESIQASLQSKDVSTGKIQFWNGEQWQVLETEIKDDIASFELNSLGVIVLTE